MEALPIVSDDADESCDSDGNTEEDDCENSSNDGDSDNDVDSDDDDAASGGAVQGEGAPPPVIDRGDTEEFVFSDDEAHLHGESAASVTFPPS
jgi:hypothetical protein